MTSDQIKNTDVLTLSTTAWLKEIALQLAIANERNEPTVKAEEVPAKRQGKR